MKDMTQDASPLYHVYIRYPGEPATTREQQNAAPLGIAAAVTLGADTVTAMQCEHGYTLDPRYPLTNSAVRQTWQLRRGGLVALVEVVEVQS